MFGHKFNNDILKDTARKIADYMSDNGERIVCDYAPESVPRRHNIKSIGIFSFKKKKEKKLREKFDMGLIWSINYHNLDEFDTSHKHDFKYLKKSLRLARKYGFKERPIKIYNKIIDGFNEFKYDPNPSKAWSVGVRFADVFLEKRYGIDLENNVTKEIDKDIDIENELSRYKDLFKKGLIDEEVYKLKQKELLGIKEKEDH